MAIKDGKIIEVGSNELITSHYSSKQIIDVQGQSIYPGFIDAHCHFYGYGKGLSQLNLAGTKSYEEVIENTQNFLQKHISR